MKDRLLKFLNTEHLSSTRFADEIGVQRSSVSHILSGRNNPSFDFIQKTLNRFTELNAEWLLTGKGEMIKNQDKPTIIDKELKPRQLNISDHSSQQAEISAPVRQTSESLFSNKVETDNIETIPENKVEKKSNEKKIERIMVFYDDKTFIEYSPGT